MSAKMIVISLTLITDRYNVNLSHFSYYLLRFKRMFCDGSNFGVKSEYAELLLQDGLAQT